MNDLPRVAVIITNYNYGDYIYQAWSSAIEQNYPADKLEIVVVDDCSTDNSRYELSGLCDFLVVDDDIETEDFRIHKGGNWRDLDGKEVNTTIIYMNRNVKQGAARNIAIKEVWDLADYFAILDADDEMMPDKISRCIAKATEFPDMIGSVHTDYYIENTETGAVTYEAKLPFNKQLLMMGDCHLHSGGVISKKAFEKVGLFDEVCVPKEDYHLWLKISDFFMCVHIPEPLVKVRVTPKNSTVSHSDEYHMKQIRLMWDRYNEWRKQMGAQT